MSVNTSGKFALPSGVIVEMMQILGFRPTLTRRRQSFQAGEFRMYTVVGQRN